MCRLLKTKLSILAVTAALRQAACYSQLILTIMNGLKEVSKEERWNFVKDKDVTYSATGDYPFVGVWKDRSGNVVAKDIPDGKHIGVNSDKYRHYIVSP